MRCMGAQVPAAFCVTTEAYRTMLEANRLGGLEGEALSGERDEARTDLQKALLECALPEGVEVAIREGIREGESRSRNRGRGWAVRSSAVVEDAPLASFAGQ